MNNVTSINELLDEVNNTMRELVGNMTSVEGDKIGLDRRAGYKIFVDTDERQIIVNLNDDRSLQYYGGFEYIDDEHKNVIGEYVVYSVESPHGEECQRLMSCICHLTDDFSQMEGYDED